MWRIFGTKRNMNGDIEAVLAPISGKIVHCTRSHIPSSDPNPYSDFIPCSLEEAVTGIADSAGVSYQQALTAVRCASSSRKGCQAGVQALATALDKWRSRINTLGNELDASAMIAPFWFSCLAGCCTAEF